MATTAVDSVSTTSKPDHLTAKTKIATTTPATSDSDFAHANLSSKLPKDLAGKPIPRAKHWGYDLTLLQPRAFVLKNLVNIGLIAAFTLFNSSALGHRVYDDLTARFGSFNLRFFGTWIITTSVLWILSGLYAIADLTGRPKWLYKYKVQPFVRVTGKEYANIALGALRNLVFVATPLMLVGAWAIPTPTSSEQLPGPLRTVAILLFDVLCTEIGFFYIHRWFHSPAMYARFHKKHHEYTAPVALAATYCTMTEHLFSNLLPNAIGALIIPHHWSQYVFAYTLLEIGTIQAHSGYYIPGLNSPLQHDFHHFAFTENFGPTGLMDAIYGTNIRYRKTLAEAKQNNNGSEVSARLEVLSFLAQREVEESEALKGQNKKAA
ncbi:uncharacterized protein PSANT_06465 [Moesziomyces antarcticus]|nr:uncharacterized protein PSANT_06465 [Moesziomyces antarcticus]